jgi:release factor glutamine methyltransferase
VSNQIIFMGVPLEVSSGVLVPREETELLGYTALSMLDTLAEPVRVIDMCCGSGNLACALASQRPAIRVWASDLTDTAIAVARSNVARLGIGERVTVVQGDLFAPLRTLGLEGSIDLVVCNPPYISTGKLEKERTDLLINEPREAFDGGPYGVSIFQRVVRDSVEFLRPGGRLMFEIGEGQERQVTAIFTRAQVYEDLSQVADRRGLPRVVSGKKKAS